MDSMVTSNNNDNKNNNTNSKYNNGLFHFIYQLSYINDWSLPCGLLLQSFALSVIVFVFLYVPRNSLHFNLVIIWWLVVYASVSSYCKNILLTSKLLP